MLSANWTLGVFLTFWLFIIILLKNPTPFHHDYRLVIGVGIFHLAVTAYIGYMSCYFYDKTLECYPESEH